MPKGRLKHAKAHRNYCFIEVDAGQHYRRDLFCHFSECDFPPEDDTRVEFEFGTHRGRDCAKNVRPVERGPDHVDPFSSPGLKFLRA